MLRLTIVLLFCIIGSLNAQDVGYYHVITVNEFSSYSAFSSSPPPHITGHGVKSDSLSRSNLVFDYYEADNEYYAIESWADYYYWLSKKYKVLFSKPEMFEHFYKAKDNISMIKYLSYNFSVWHFPSAIRIEPHIELSDSENRFSLSNHIIKNETDLEYMLKQIEAKQEKYASKD
ncbi:hypothetical protein [Flammeovirga kamogawensis]|uniref:DUF4105 domain-containing protein n=1 Tax=Flammeovirga kamogawensis TaxID=373891 RepID=A0ABX8GZM1_9BACT|nr:hypothetical protein [Flammeovirga kamogawensis]MBB6459525.1 hypothetical protein [Flammeovirga kamogawensis]QWG09076.1 hypothetical protein KM029_09060 [Flammeovirga kamogawensis]TRX67364.1 hypothetical protein EO216_04100 [Flammeovirga kamogawensis]